MTLSIKNGGYAFLIRLDLMFSMSLWKEFQLLQILNDLSIKHLIIDTPGKNLCFTEFSTKIHWSASLAASDVFYMFTQSMKFFWFHYRTDV